MTETKKKVQGTEEKYGFIYIYSRVPKVESVLPEKNIKQISYNRTKS